MIIESQEPLLNLDGIGEAMAKKLREAGITSIKMLSMFSVEELMRDVGIGYQTAKKINKSSLQTL